MKNTQSALFGFAIAALVLSTAQAGSIKGTITKDERKDLLQRGQVLVDDSVRANPDLVKSKDILKGSGVFESGQTIACDFEKVENPGGTTPKFECKVNMPGHAMHGKKIKVKYFADKGKSGELFAAVTATRLAWALGFPNNDYYPAIVHCKGCTEDPWKDRNSDEEPSDTVQTFDVAAVQVKTYQKVEAKPDQGWSFDELDKQVDPSRGGASKAERDAIKLFAIFIQHGDNKAMNNTLSCIEGSRAGEGGPIQCAKPVLVMQDIGSTFGEGGATGGKTKLYFKSWSSKPVFAKPESCEGQLGGGLFSLNNMGNKKISEAGREFFYQRISRLSDEQIRNLFTLGRYDLWKSMNEMQDDDSVTVDQWVAAFKKKVSEIGNITCPN